MAWQKSHEEYIRTPRMGKGAWRTTSLIAKIMRDAHLWTVSHKTAGSRQEFNSNCLVCTLYPRCFQELSSLWTTWVWEASTSPYTYLPATRVVQCSYGLPSWPLWSHPAYFFILSCFPLHVFSLPIMCLPTTSDFSHLSPSEKQERHRKGAVLGGPDILGSRCQFQLLQSCLLSKSISLGTFDLT